MPRSRVAVDMSKFAMQLRRTKATSRRAFSAILKENMKGFMGSVQNSTPPGMTARKEAKQDTKARKRGENNVASDIAQIFRGTSNPKRVESNDLIGLHKRYKMKKNGRTIELKRKIRVPIAALRAHIKMKVSHVGRLAAGWNAAAIAVGHKPPQWIMRHGTANGRIITKFGETKLSIKAVNSVDYASDQFGHERRIQIGLNEQAHKMRRRINSAVDAGKLAPEWRMGK